MSKIKRICSFTLALVFLGTNVATASTSVNHVTTQPVQNNLSLTWTS